MLMAFARTFYIVQYVEDGNSAQYSFFIADLNLQGGMNHKFISISKHFLVTMF